VVCGVTLERAAPGDIFPSYATERTKKRLESVAFQHLTLFSCEQNIRVRIIIFRAEEAQHSRSTHASLSTCTPMRSD